MTKEYELQAKAWTASENYTDGLRLWAQRYGENITYKMLCMGPNDFNREKMRSGLMLDVQLLPDPEPVKPEPAKKKVSKIARLEETVDELEGSVQDISSEVDDLGDAVSGLSDGFENIESTVSDIASTVDDLNAKMEEFLARNEKPVLPSVKHPDVDEKEPEEVQEWHRRTYGLMNERVLLKQRLRDLEDPARRADRKKAAFRILDITAELDELFGKIHYFEEHGRVPSNVPIEEQGVLYPRKYLNLRTYVSRTRKKLSAATEPGAIAALEKLIKEYEREMKQIEIDL